MTKAFKAAVRLKSSRFSVEVLQEPDGPNYRRDGGKPAADTLLKPVRSKKRATILRWFLQFPNGIRVGDAVQTLNLTRSAILSYWYFIHREHGIGYTLTNNIITPRLPPGCDASNVFGDA
ncbi:hypothetical protein JQ608_06895 [Bradyrhizobium liaoningense]|uniref:hypothetical protein n=1 Tax=Bradyrhizobium liaoningense TaxID=43992 RepID=UPI001BA671C9|nr:hypothetical protein [Bradyrhizobium liaoningense]MBR0876929.1 hypothetical protein [Bradyrhizobium liaoningense]